MNALSIKNLTKIYPNGQHALKGIDIEVAQGDFFALLGANGAGKSTTIHIITSLTTKSSGQVAVFGYDIDRQYADAKACIGIVPQEFNFNIFENCIDILVNAGGYYGLPRKLSRIRAEKYLKKLDLWDKRNSTARELSGGMKRRLMIARALIHQPKLLILDEPTAGVDIEIRRAMWDFLREINREGTTVILTTHYLEEAENLCRNIAIIDHGEIIEHTTMRELLNKLTIETFILYVTEPLHFCPELKGIQCRLIDEHTLEIDVHKDQSMNEVYECISGQNIHVSSMRNKANRLETLFLDMIGQNNDTSETK